MQLDELTMADYVKAVRKTKTVIVPYGTVEEHGQHLPLSTDTIVMTEVARAAAERVAVFVAPPLHYGVCTSTGQHPGTIGITAETVRSLTVDIVRDGFRKGLKRFILISGHAGGLHMAAMREAGERLVEELPGVEIAALSIYDLVRREITEMAETENDSHAGEMETSLILHIAERLVKGRSKEEYPKLPKLFLVREKLKCWPGGVWGNPHAASAEKGERLFTVMVDKVVEVVREISRRGE